MTYEGLVVVDEFKAKNFQVLKTVYDNARDGIFDSWFVDKSTHTDRLDQIHQPSDQTTSIPFEFKTHAGGMFPIAKDELVYFAHCELNTPVDIPATVEFRFRRA